MWHVISVQIVNIEYSCAICVWQNRDKIFKFLRVYLYVINIIYLYLMYNGIKFENIYKVKTDDLDLLKFTANMYDVQYVYRERFIKWTILNNMNSKHNFTFRFSRILYFNVEMDRPGNYTRRIRTKSHCFDSMNLMKYTEKQRHIIL